MAREKKSFSKTLLLDVQELVEKGASKEKIGFSSNQNEVTGSLSYLKDREKELLLLLLKKYKHVFTPIEVSRDLKVTNRTVINRLSVLSQNGFVVPIMVNQRIRSYELSDYTKEHENEILNILNDKHINTRIK